MGIWYRVRKARKVIQQIESFLETNKSDSATKMTAYINLEIQPYRATHWCSWVGGGGGLFDPLRGELFYSPNDVILEIFS